MKRKWKKIVLAALAIIIGLPVALVVMVLVWTSIADKTNGAIVSSGVTRRYLLYVPKTYDRSRLTPLVITMHGGGSWPAAAMYISRWNEVAEQHGFIVVYPAGSGAFWGGFSPGPHVWPMGPRSLGREVRFISDLIDKLEAEYNIDPNRIYADGMSNGGGMALALSCRLSDRIAAVGAVAQLRQTSKGRFLSKDYRDHCEQGGHPVARGGILLGGRNAPAAQVLLADLLVHCWRTWDQVVHWSAEFPRASAAVVAHGSQISWRLDSWGKQDPLYALMVAIRPENPAP
jgi:poly(3-hydroxybutyrate) depolymerase